MAKPILEFNEVHLETIKNILDKDISQTNKFYELEELGFLIFEGAIGKSKERNPKKDAMFIHRTKDEIRVQLETGFGFGNIAKFIYFRNK
jgi:sRNA-binding protein